MTEAAEDARYRRERQSMMARPSVQLNRGVQLNTPRLSDPRPPEIHLPSSGSSTHELIFPGASEP